DAPFVPPINLRGSYEYDQAHGFNLKWSNVAELERWIKKEEETKTIELIRKEARPNPDKGGFHLWDTRYFYVCGRSFTGGKNKYTKKHSWTRKVPVKRTGCPCRLTVASYPGTDTLLGMYNDVHTHDIGNQNVRFTRLPKETRLEIERLLRL
ncbi:hypothetical protein FPV67DRAFT_1372462, partial [Lyophyllum atratum]